VRAETRSTEPEPVEPEHPSSPISPGTTRQPPTRVDVTPSEPAQSADQANDIYGVVAEEDTTKVNSGTPILAEADPLPLFPFEFALYAAPGSKIPTSTFLIDGRKVLPRNGKFHLPTGEYLLTFTLNETNYELPFIVSESALHNRIYRNFY
ncbi:MAG: hypothetical protein AAFN92_06450, partial [Bacteroidota bacterium]